MVSRAQGCLLGQLAGDALGSMVEFQRPEDIRRSYPHRIRELADGGRWNTIAGQPTDDSEMALLLARMLVEQGRYDAEEARKAYRFWLDSRPFDCGNTVYVGLRGRPNSESQANGAMMRISPLGIFGTNYDLQQVAAWAQQDAALTHPHPVCLQANALFTMAIAHVISTGTGSEDLFQQIEAWAREIKVEDALLKSITGASTAPPNDYVHQQGALRLSESRRISWPSLRRPHECRSACRFHEETPSRGEPRRISGRVSLQLSVLCLGFLQDGDVGVGEGRTFQRWSTLFHYS